MYLNRIEIYAENKTLTNDLNLYTLHALGYDLQIRLFLSS